MSILLYCISRWPSRAGESILGVAGHPVTHRQSGELAAFISSALEGSVWLQQPLRTAAVEFHRVCTEIFEKAAIIPFRFPTTFETEEELDQHLQQRSEEYKALLAKFRDAIQMEIHIAVANSATVGKSGTNYLKKRQESIRVIEQFSDEIQKKLTPLITDCRQRPLKDGIRLFALLNRNSRAKFEETMRGSPVTSGLKVRVSGPWPVSEFLEPR